VSSPARGLPRAEPWNFGTLLPWSAAAVVGDPLLVIVPFAALVGLILAALAVSAPADPDVLLPLLSLSPIDAYQDVAIVDYAGVGTAATWALRALFWAIRVAVTGTIVVLVVQRAREQRTDLVAAVRTVRERVGAVAFLELLAFAAFGSTLVLRAGLADARSDGSVAGALFFGLLFMPNALIAALADGLPAGRALARSFAWVRRRPLGHVALVLAYAAAAGGLRALASAGETGRPPAFATTLLTFVAAFVTVVFLAALSRRYVLLYSLEPARPGVRRPRARTAS
jgi:hypothetical protein